MLKRWGIEDRLDLTLFLSLILLVAVSPLGNEATNPIILGIYRTLLLVIIVSSTARLLQNRLPQISLLFLATTGIVVFGMYASVVFRPGSHFDGIYNFYQNVLFLIAFISLASFQRTRSPQWKGAVLGSIVLIDIVYLIAAWIRGARPMLGPFVNPNYFASYLLVGLAVCTAAALFSRTLSIRIGAAGTGLILFYGIGQTSSRGVFLSVLAVLSVALFRTARQYRIAWWQIAAIGVVIVVIAGIANPSLVHKFSDLGQHDPYNYERTQIWMKSLSMIGAHPILGVGLGRFYFVSKLFTPAVEGTIGRYGKWANIAHSEYLQYAAELGLPIALLMFAIGAYLFQLAWRRAKTVSKDSRIYQEAALLTAVGLGTHALVDNNWTVPVVAAGLAVISLADLLPYGHLPFQIKWTPVKMMAAGILITAVFVQAVKIPTLGLYFNEAGHKAYLAGDFERAERSHRLGLGIVPDHPVMLDNLGMVYFEQYLKTHKIEYLDRAESKFRDSIAVNPGFDLPAGHLEAALFRRLTGNASKDQAIHALIVETDSLRMRFNPYNPFTRKNLAEALYNIGRKQEAIRELQTSVELEPNFVQAYVRLADWDEAAGQLTEAATYRTKANEVITHYKDQATTDPFEAMLLNRPLPSTGKP